MKAPLTPSAMKPDDALSTRRERRRRSRQHFDLVPLIGIIPSFVLASYALTQPWAKARLFFVWGISRSPEAVTLVIMALTGMIVSTTMVAFKSRRRRVTAFVLILTGIVMAGTTWLAYRYVKEAGIKLLGVIPISTVKPGSGLYLFVVASGLVIALGIFELALSLWFGSRTDDFRRDS